MDFSLESLEDILKDLRKPKWTSTTFLTLVERFVFRNRITQEFKEKVAGLDDETTLNMTDGVELLNMLYTNTNDMEELYGPPDILMKDLFIHQQFPNNSSFLGLEESLNYLIEDRMIISDTNGNKFWPFPDFYVIFWRSMFANFDDGIFEVTQQLLAKSFGNKLYREMKGKFGILPMEYCEKLMNHMNSDKKYKPAELPAVFKKSKITSFNEVYAAMASFYDPEYDEELLQQLKYEFKQQTLVSPLVTNKKGYRDSYLDHYDWTITLQKTFNIETLTKEMNSIPFVRFFFPADVEEIKDLKCCLAVELKHALNIAMQKRFKKPFPDGLITVETEEEKKIGVLRAVEWDKMLKILKIVKIPISDLNIFEDELHNTSRGKYSPVNTTHGTYCKLAWHAFTDVFQEVSTGLKLFQAISKENFPKIVDWFDQFSDVFSGTKNYRYFVEIWKIEEIIDRAYEELQQYITEPIYEINDRSEEARNFISSKAALKELFKFAPNFERQKWLREVYSKTLQKCPAVCRAILPTLYENSIRTAFLGTNVLYERFIKYQTMRDCSGEMYEFTNYADKLERTILKIAPEIPDDEYVEYSKFEELLNQEMKQHNSLTYHIPYYEDAKKISKIGQLFTELFETIGNNQIRRRRIRMETVKEVEDLMPTDPYFTKMYQEGEAFKKEGNSEERMKRICQYLNEDMNYSMHGMFKIDNAQHFTNFIFNKFMNPKTKK